MKTKNTRKTYTIDFENKKIELTASMVKKAQDVTSDAFATIAKIRQDFPDFTVVVKEAKKINRPSMEGLSMDYMEAYIKILAPKKEPDYNRRKLAKLMLGKNPYMTLRKWFDETFSDWRLHLKDEEIIQAIAAKHTLANDEQPEAHKSSR